MTSSNIERDFYIAPVASGVKLCPPDDEFGNQLTTVGEALNFPCNVYFLNPYSSIQSINDRSAHSCGFVSSHDAIGRTVFDVLKPVSAHHLVEVDKAVVTQGKLQISDDSICLKNDSQVDFVSFKTPLLGNKNEIIGIFGCSIAIGMQPLAESMRLIKKLGILGDIFSSQVNNILQYQYIHGVYYTRRQSEIIYYTVNGKTAEQVAQQLNISRRTVEHYLDLIKTKMNVRTRSQLIEVALSNVK